MSYQIEKTERSSSGLEANIAGLLCYLGVFLLGAYFLATEKKSRFVRFHAMQSTATFGALFIAQIVLNVFGLYGLAPLVGLVAFGVWLFMMYKAYSWELYRLPIAGDIAAKELEKPLPT
jgi:uncharacterized membrane protein